MAIKDKNIKLLWSNAAGRCSFTDCGMRLTVEQAAHEAPYTLGEMAHIKGENKGSNRYDETQTNEERNSYENLILLCPNHHTLIDKPENECMYSVDVLKEMKIAHENNVLARLEAKEFRSVEKVKGRIAIYLAENRQVWLKYGPMSELALKNPHSEEIFAIWTSERLSTIVPNNRLMESLLKVNRDLFDRKDQPTISEFLLHVKSYEKWVEDEIPYHAVTRFPPDFEHLIMGK